VRAELLSHTSFKQLRAAIGYSGVSDGDLLPHASFTFAIEGISRVCSHQLVRHRVASYSQQSQRYIPVRKLRERVVVPPSVRELGQELFSANVDAASQAYEGLVDSGVPREDARFVLPNATETNLLITMEGRSLLHFFGLRCCERAQWEIKELADGMLREVRAAEPELFRGAGPYCRQLGRCPEGRFTCGKMNEVMEMYSCVSS